MSTPVLGVVLVGMGLLGLYFKVDFSDIVLVIGVLAIISGDAW